MMTSYFIYRQDMARVAEVFESFNKNFEEFCSIFEIVTGQDLDLDKFDVRYLVLNVQFF